jgi:hypothetical protein
MSYIRIKSLVAGLSSSPVSNVSVLIVNFCSRKWEFKSYEHIVLLLILTDSFENVQGFRLVLIIFGKFSGCSVFHFILYFNIPYNFIMLNITNLTLILSQPNTLYIANKQLKISTGNYNNS